MRKAVFLTAILLAISTLTIPSRAQQKMEAIKPADSPSKVVLDSWNDIGRKLIAMAEDFPEDKYDFKATPAERSFAEQLLHAAGANYYFTYAAMGDKTKVDENPSRSVYKTKADVVAYVKKSFADGAAAIKAKGDKGMNHLVVDPFAHQQVRVGDWAYGFIEH
ncbi:MAG TPA: DinB family protein, partial [Candidatus Sulfotelmatobacter sp.]